MRAVFVDVTGGLVDPASAGGAEVSVRVAKAHDGRPGAHARAAGPRMAEMPASTAVATP